MSIEKIIQNIDKMREHFKKSGFENVRLFKGFGGSDGKTAYLVVALASGQSEDLTAIDKKTRLESELKDLLGFYVGVTLETNMAKNYLSLINEKESSINLSEVTEKTVLREKLEVYLGKDWKFDEKDPYAEERHAPPSSEMVNFAKNFGNPPPSAIFSTVQKNELNSTPQKAGESISKLSYDLSQYTKEELVLLKAKIDQQILEIESKSSELNRSY